MSASFDVIVVGVGSMGSATCRELARRGARVLGLEQFTIPHGLGSFHGWSRMIRLAYSEHPDYVPLLHRAYELWDRLENETGERVLFRTGGLYMGEQGSPFVQGASQSARDHKLAHAMLDHADLRREYPQFVLPEDYVALFEPMAGFLLSEQVVATLASLAMQAGAELHGHESVVAWKPEGTGVRVETAKGVYLARKLVVAGGAWSAKLLDTLGVRLNVTRQVLGWVQPKRFEPFALGNCPVWGIGHLDGTLHYGFPIVNTFPGLKTAYHSPGQSADPDRIVREPTAGDEETFRGVVRRYLPDADGPTLALRICMYTYSPDQHFIVGPLPGPASDRVVIACGMSGHGFKFSLVLGEALADLAAEGSTRLPIEFLSPTRFADSKGVP